VYAKDLVDAMRIPVRHARWHGTKYSCVLDGLRDPLGKMRQGCVACVVDEGDGSVDPCRQRSVDAEFLLAHILVWDEVQQAFDLETGVCINGKHG